GVRVGGLHDALGLRLGVANTLGFGDEALLLGNAFVHGALVGIVAGLDEAVGFRGGAGGDVVVFVASLGDQAVSFILGLGDRGGGTLFGVAHHRFRTGVSLLKNPIALRLGIGDHAVGAILSIVKNLVAVVEDVLGVVHLDGNGVTHLVEDVEHLAARHHAIGCHGHAISLLHHVLEIVHALEGFVHVPHYSMFQGITSGETHRSQELTIFSSAGAGGHGALRLGELRRHCLSHRFWQQPRDIPAVLRDF